MNIIEMHLVMDDIETRLPIAKFDELMFQELKSVSFTSKLLSRKGTVSDDELRQSITTARVRAVQRIRDERQR